MKNLLILIASSMLLISCAKTPMQELKSDTVTNNDYMTYWWKQATYHTALWQQATNYCIEHHDKPNCAIVINIININKIIAETKVPSQPH